MATRRLNRLDRWHAAGENSLPSQEILRRAADQGDVGDVLVTAAGNGEVAHFQHPAGRATRSVPRMLSLRRERTHLLSMCPRVSRSTASLVPECVPFGTVLVSM